MAPTTAAPTSSVTAAPTATPSSQPTDSPTAPPSHEPTALPTALPSAEATTPTPSAEPTVGPTVEPVGVANVTFDDGPVSLVLGGQLAVTVAVALPGPANASVAVAVRRLRLSDIISALQSVTVQFPSDLSPVTGLVFSGEMPYMLRVTIDTSAVSPYVAAGRTVRTFATGSWVEPASGCANATNTSVATTVDDVLVVTYVCAGDSLLVVADPRGTTDRDCPRGKYSCDCSSTSAYSANPPHRALYLVSLVLHALASLLDVEYDSHALSTPVRGAAYALLLVAGSINPLGDADSSWPVAGLDHGALRVLLLVPAALAAVLFATGVFLRSDYVLLRVVSSEVVMDDAPPAAAAPVGCHWTGYDRAHRVTRFLHQFLLGVAVAAATELVWPTTGSFVVQGVWPAGSVVVAIFLVGVLLETLTPAVSWAYWVSRALIVSGLLLCAAVLLAEPCGSAYGKDRPATVLY